MTAQRAHDIEPNAGPYAGLRVVELVASDLPETAIAYAGMLLADRGAEVIKLRATAAQPAAPAHAWLDRGKR